MPPPFSRSPRLLAPASCAEPGAEPGRISQRPAAARGLAPVKRLEVHILAPQRVHQHGQFARHRHDRLALRAGTAARRQTQSPAPQQRVFPVMPRMYCEHCTSSRRNKRSPLLGMLRCGERSPESRRFGRSPIRGPASRLRRRRGRPRLRRGGLARSFSASISASTLA